MVKRRRRRRKWTSWRVWECPFKERNLPFNGEDRLRWLYLNSDLKEGKCQSHVDSQKRIFQRENWNIQCKVSTSEGSQTNMRRTTKEGSVAEP